MARYHDGEEQEANADTVDGEHAADIVTDARVKAHFPDTTANVLSDHDKAAHDALLIDADTVDGEEAAAIVTNARVKAHFPDTTANVLSDHDKAAHDALDIDADTLDTKHYSDISSEIDGDITTHAALDTGVHGAGAETLLNSGDKNVANGIAGLDAAAKVPTAYLGGAGASSSNFLRGDQTWATPSGAGPALQGTVAIDPAEIAKATTENVDVSVSGLLTTHVVWVQCQSDLEHGLVCIAAYCPTDGTLRVRISNLSAAAVDGASRTWAYQAY